MGHFILRKVAAAFDDSKALVEGEGRESSSSSGSGSGRGGLGQLGVGNILPNPQSNILSRLLSDPLPTPLSNPLSTNNNHP